MSLIQEALKRKSEEASQREIEAPPPSPPAAPPTPPAPRLQPLFFLGALLVLLLGGAFYQLQRSTLFLTKAPDAPESPTDQPIRSAHPSEAPPTSMASATAESTPDEPERSQPVQPEPAPELTWPELTYSGAAAGGNQVLAIINGRMISAGETIQGARVLQIGKSEVLVEYKGQKRILHVDNPWEVPTQ